tara:strand:+ start:572 stop:778 length:207 start_codon:yes stop_codon:yes gene_type:complete
MSKGSRRRPVFVPDKKFGEAWDLIFGTKDKEHEQNNQSVSERGRRESDDGPSDKDQGTDGASALQLPV